MSGMPTGAIGLLLGAMALAVALATAGMVVWLTQQAVQDWRKAKPGGNQQCEAVIAALMVSALLVFLALASAGAWVLLVVRP